MIKIAVSIDASSSINAFYAIEKRFGSSAALAGIAAENKAAEDPNRAKSMVDSKLDSDLGSSGQISKFISDTYRLSTSEAFTS
ncbi:hypothetical protein TSUD_321490 [Trifolium subterraneum]|uniref:Uncharacterized protein n=1 Tax=Trifolium subterraneum TaxID=3900 RepID=A0A2Z6N2J5_TRISU|nr:hypothetical protein TSUD_321490 [Trifolium subterraneum]